MGQKINPYGFRLGITTDWKSRWFSEKDYKKYLHEDSEIRRYLKRNLSHAGISEWRSSAPATGCGSTSTRPAGRGHRPPRRRGDRTGRPGQDDGKQVTLNISRSRAPRLTPSWSPRAWPSSGHRVSFRRPCAGDQLGHEGRGQGIGSSARAASAAPRWPAPSSTVRAGSRCHAAGRDRLRPGRGPHHLRDGRGQGLDLQGRRAALAREQEADRARARARAAAGGPAASAVRVAGATQRQHCGRAVAAAPRRSAEKPAGSPRDRRRLPRPLPCRDHPGSGRGRPGGRAGQGVTDRC